MSIQFNTELDTYTAVDEYGVVLAIYDQDVHGTVRDFRSFAHHLVAGA